MFFERELAVGAKGNLLLDLITPHLEFISKKLELK